MVWADGSGGVVVVGDVFAYRQLLLLVKLFVGVCSKRSTSKRRVVCTSTQSLFRYT
jgi:hypothetical protein